IDLPDVLACREFVRESVFDLPISEFAPEPEIDLRDSDRGGPDVVLGTKGQLPDARRRECAGSDQADQDRTPEQGQCAPTRCQSPVASKRCPLVHTGLDVIHPSPEFSPWSLVQHFMQTKPCIASAPHPTVRTPRRRPSPSRPPCRRDRG